MDGNEQFRVRWGHQHGYAEFEGGDRRTLNRLMWFTPVGRNPASDAGKPRLVFSGALSFFKENVPDHTVIAGIDQQWPTTKEAS